MNKLTNRWICADTIRRIFAGWAVCQHPFHQPPELFKAIEVLVEFCEPDRNGMVRVRSLPLFLERLEEAIKALPICDVWNRPRKGNAKYVFVSRYFTVNPEYDFIDIDALARNVSRDIGRHILSDE